MKGGSGVKLLEAKEATVWSEILLVTSDWREMKKCERDAGDERSSTGTQHLTFRDNVVHEPLNDEQ